MPALPCCNHKSNAASDKTQADFGRRILVQHRGRV